MSDAPTTPPTTKNPAQKYGLPPNVRARIRGILEIVCASRRKCKLCDRQLFFILTADGNLAPYTDDAINHYADCPQAEAFRKKTPGAQAPG